ncbi:E3 ubiquitin/ISG15 ligase TRIM25-like [Engraulis encrasicolus]|uniref:E3 ubiquitin/ISG15 ligase TRIM25-like n=1 Tax=Engraulis encrasicolus TaxID=184585 RepID=UPI002FD72DFA
MVSADTAQPGIGYRLQTPRAVSPVPSCVSMKSDKSMGDPPNFSREPPQSDPRLQTPRPVSPVPSCVSIKSDKSMGDPPNFSRDPPQSDPSLLTNEDFKCSVCTGVLKDPVSIPCGHSYCKQCITSYWEQPSQAGHYACPQCPRTYSSHPALYSNSALALVVHKLEHFSPVLPAQSYAGPGDVECDFCTGRKLKAVKTCLTCTASFCGTHVKEHYTIPALQRHTLVEAVETMEEKMVHTELKEPHRSDSGESPIPSWKRHRQEEDPVLHVMTAMQQEMRQLKRQVRKEEKNIRDQQQELAQQLQEAREQQRKQSSSRS